MPLNKRALPIKFEGGVETRSDPKTVPATKLLDLVNATFTKQTTIAKRNGYRALNQQIQDNGGTVENAKGLGAREDGDGELLVFTDKRCYSERPSADRWADTGEVAATTATTMPLARTGTYQTQPDRATRNGLSVAAWEDSRGGVWCSVIESSTGRILRSQFQLDASALALNPRCLAVGEVLFVLWTRSDLGQINIALINPATPELAPTISILTADLDAANVFYDACDDPLGPASVIDQRPGLIAWAQSGGGFRVGYIAPAGVLGSPATSLPSVVSFTDILTGPIAIAPDTADSSVVVAWVGGASVVRLRRLAASTLVSAVFVDPVATSGGGAYTKITIGLGAVTSTGMVGLYWAAETTAARTDLCAIESGAVDLSAGVAGPFTRLRGHGLVSRAWHDGGLSGAIANTQGDVYVTVAHTVRFFPYLAVLRLSDTDGIASPTNTIVSRLMPGEAAGALMRTTGAGTRAWTQHLPTGTQEGIGASDQYSRQHAVMAPYRIQLSSVNGDQFSEQGLKVAAVNFDVAYQTVQFGRGLYLASSAPMHYDGDAWHEADFHTAPDFGFDSAGAPVDISTAIAIGAAGAITDGVRLYAYWYEAVDAQGELHRGAVSVKILATMTGGPKKFTHTIPTCRLTRFTNVRICVARSVAGATGTDSTLSLFKVTSNDVTVSTGDNRYVLNDPTVDTVTFSDNLSDALLIAREPLYTNGGILNNAPSPWGGGVIATGGSRMFWNDSTDPHVVRFSQTLVDDTALEAPVDLSLRVDPFGGGINAITVMDGAVYPLCETAIYVFGGPGPDADGGLTSQNGFSPAELVTSDAGCSQSRTVCNTPTGILFQSVKGIQLLNRARQLLYVGAPVEIYNDQTYVRSTLFPDRQQVVLLTASGRTLAWDYGRDQWSTFTNHEGLDAVILGGSYYYLRTDSRVFVETIGQYRDDNSRIPMMIETAWVHFAKYLQGWQRILYAYFLGEFESDHTLSVRFRLDYEPNYSPASLSDVNANYNPSVYGGGIYGGGSYGGGPTSSTRYQRRIHINRRCQSISFRIEDIEATGDFGASFELAEMLLIGGGLGPDFKVGAQRSA